MTRTKHHSPYTYTSPPHKRHVHQEGGVRGLRVRNQRQRDRAGPPRVRDRERQLRGVVRCGAVPAVHRRGAGRERHVSESTRVLEPCWLNP